LAKIDARSCFKVLSTQIVGIQHCGFLFYVNFCTIWNQKGIWYCMAKIYIHCLMYLYIYVCFVLLIIWTIYSIMFQTWRWPLFLPSRLLLHLWNPTYGVPSSLGKNCLMILNTEGCWICQQVRAQLVSSTLIHYSTM